MPVFGCHCPAPILRILWRTDTQTPTRSIIILSSSCGSIGWTLLALPEAMLALRNFAKFLALTKWPKDLSVGPREEKWYVFWGSQLFHFLIWTILHDFWHFIFGRYSKILPNQRQMKVAKCHLNTLWIKKLENYDPPKMTIPLLLWLFGWDFMTILRLYHIL